MATTTTTTFDLDLPDPSLIRDPGPWYHLNWSSFRSLRMNQRKLTHVQRWYLQKIDERIRRFDESFARTDAAEANYRAFASMIAMACARNGDQDCDASSDLSFKDRFLQCRTLPTKYNSRGTCRVRRYCPFCNYLIRQEALRTYVPAFDNGTWYFMTISSTSYVDFELDEPTYSWDAGKAVVKALLKAGFFDGAYWTEEISLHSLLPKILVHPHCHVIFHAKAGVDLVRAKAMAERKFRQHFAALEHKAVREGYEDSLTLLEPSIELKALLTEDDHYRATDYLTKTVSEDGRTNSVGVVDVYRNALDDVGEGERWRVNVAFEQFLSGMELFLEEDSSPRKIKDRPTREPRPRSRIQRHRLGTLRPGRSRRFVGIRPADRPKYRRKVREIRRRVIADSGASRSEDDASLMIDL